jgi:hypothetical protein
MKYLILSLALFAFHVNAAEPPKKAPAKKEAAAPAIKPQVKRPCKPGQTEEKDGCHEVKKLK